MFFEERQIRFYLQINLKFVLIRTSKERFAVTDNVSAAVESLGE
ncbi:hypothetical protein LEP1GSC036_4145 [Leptospira weilii str. 2006001853]|uniref:Uncharacterized protein n=1 Tax=Leptospira weilii str. 2006001853 TaxID=1001589 RepID=A0A828YZS3_9LEPT|nr:hypothetical protein LEP1GSC036_4145 [Leptospira weilii str. 2006001853]EMJ65186.1 hypothetical protein LEP1GSC051_4177 [Leptospira sp. P2653]